MKIVWAKCSIRDPKRSKERQRDWNMFPMRLDLIKQYFPLKISFFYEKNY